MLFRRRLTICIAAALFCFVLLSLWNVAKYLKSKTPILQSTKLNDVQRFHDSEKSVVKSRGVQAMKSDYTKKPNQHREVKSVAKVPCIKLNKAKKQRPKDVVTSTKLDKAQKQRLARDKAKKESRTRTTTLDKKTETTDAQFTTARPLNCSGCFNTNFSTLADQPDLCQVKGRATIDLVFLIVSAHKNKVRRDAIRKTWASVTKNNTANLRHVFMLGTTTDAKLTLAVAKEAENYRDVVITGFHDSYKNLTLKVITSLRWFTTRCQRARFFMKVDDDVWINTAVVTSLMRNHSDFLQHGMGGHCSSTFRPRRGKGSKWYVPEYVYPGERYPAYCQGLAYASSFTVAQRIVNVSADVPFFNIEDVYMGMCLHRLGLGTRPLGKFKHHRNQDPCQGKSAKVPAIHNVPPRTMMQLWSAECPVPTASVNRTVRAVAH